MLAIYTFSKTNDEKERSRMKEKGITYAQNHDFIYYSDKLNRNSWKGLLKSIKTRKVNQVWIWNFDDLKLPEIDALLHIVKQRNCELIVKDTKIDLSLTSPFIKKLEAKFLQAQTPCHFLTKQIIHTNHVVSVYRKNANIFGYDYPPKNKNTVITINNNDATIVAKIFDLYDDQDDDQDISFRGICKELNPKFKKSNGKDLSSFQVSNILRRPEYCGRQWNEDHSDTFTSTKFPQISGVTYELWKRVKIKLQTKSNHLPKPIPKNPTSGFLKCTCFDCEAPYYVNTSKGYFFNKKMDKIIESEKQEKKKKTNQSDQLNKSNKQKAQKTAN